MTKKQQGNFKCGIGYLTGQTYLNLFLATIYSMILCGAIKFLFEDQWWSLLLMGVVCLVLDGGCLLYTSPEFQHRGIYRELDRRADDEIRRRGGSFSCLVPANPGLFPMYRKLGYDTAFFIEEGLVQGRGKAFYEFHPCSFEEFWVLREEFLDSLKNPVRHPKKELRYIFEELRQFSGDVLLYEEDGKRCYAAFTCAADGIYLRECSGKAWERTARSLMERYGKKTVKVHSPLLGKKLQTVPFGMGKYLAAGDLPLREHLSGTGYMALMLD